MAKSNKPVRQAHKTKKIDGLFDSLRKDVTDEFPRPVKSGSGATVIDAQSYLAYDSEHEEARKDFFDALTACRKAFTKLRSTPYYSSRARSKS